jgi:DNA processing protein
VQGTDLNPDPCPSAELPHWIQLAETPGVGRRTGHALVAAFGSPAKVLAAGYAALRQHVPEAIALALCELDKGVALKIAVAQDWLALPGHHLLPFTHPAFPATLHAIPDPPLMLYCIGDPALLSRPMLAIVGSRNASVQGRANAEAFAKALSGAGLAIVSGLALGIDAHAHAGGLQGAGSTVAVVGTGVDLVYPRRHQQLAARIASEGCIVSEYSLGTPVLASNFPPRNRIISGLSLGVLVVEAATLSGSLITARMALEQGREVFAVPGSIHSALSKGCHSLIKQGAALVETADDILAQLNLRSHAGWLAPASGADRQGTTGPARPTVDTASPDQPVLDAIGHDPVHPDTLQARLGCAPGLLSSQLLALELAGLVERLPGGLLQRLAR